MQRIRGRDRYYERNMEDAYIAQLAEAYDCFFSRPEWKDRLVVIETDHLNPITSAEDLNSIVTRIRQSLHLEPYQQTLPL
jgi:deoxyadenosine/deoxycytidine kinase